MAFDGWYPKAKRLNITTREYFTQRAVPLVGIVEHITDGDDSRDWLQHADNGASVHFLIRVEGGVGVVYQFMPIHWTAWGNGRYSLNNPYAPEWVKKMIADEVNINHGTVSIEHERNWPFTTVMGGAMLEASIELHKWLVEVAPTIRRNREYIIGHYQVDHISRANCPGGPGGALFPFDTIIGAIQQPSPAPPPAVYLDAVTGVPVTGKFAKYFLLQGGITNFGRPLAGEKQDVLEDGNTYTVQAFERALLHHRGDEPVGEARLGYEYAKAKGWVA
jgi:N-acetyl-anhydromuramyl-L-alanine amidase AmpD